MRELAKFWFWGVCGVYFPQRSWRITRTIIFPNKTVHIASYYVFLLSVSLSLSFAFSLLDNWFSTCLCAIAEPTKMFVCYLATACGKVPRCSDFWQPWETSTTISLANLFCAVCLLFNGQEDLFGMFSKTTNTITLFFHVCVCVCLVFMCARFCHRHS